MSEQDGPFDVRRAGVLLHVTSLPGDGDLGDEAHRFIDFLAAAGCSVWQVLPLVPTHDDDGSPYNAPSAMAGNPDLISKAQRHTADDAAFTAWCAEQSAWLEPYVEYTALRELRRTPWHAWEPALRDRDPRAVADALAPHAQRVQELKVEQWDFAQQWRRLREHATSKGVLLFGDLPIFVSLDSADVWAHRELFELDAAGRPITVTGCPPDYFAEDGQLWNNPHYDWAAMAAEDFAWWRLRIARQRELFDLVRIDHFRGFEAAWHVPVEAPTARDGQWVEAPGEQILAALVETAGPGTLVAEDLGVITPQVDQLRNRFGLPGMKVLQFAFDGTLDNPHLPAHHEELSVVYTGTHDNDTTVGWWTSIDERTRTQVRSHLINPDEPMPGAFIRLAMESPARLAVVPAQDLLALGSESRMNTPGTDEGNWAWQAPEGAFGDELAAGLRAVVEHSGRT